MGKPNDFLGIQIVRHSLTPISLHEAPYTQQLCDLFNISALSPQALPMDPKLQLVKKMGPQMNNPEKFRKLVGALIHLTSCARLDVTYAVHVAYAVNVANYNSDP